MNPKKSEIRGISSPVWEKRINKATLLSFIHSRIQNDIKNKLKWIILVFLSRHKEEHIFIKVLWLAKFYKD